MKRHRGISMARRGSSRTVTATQTRSQTRSAAKRKREEDELEGPAPATRPAKAKKARASYNDITDTTPAKQPKSAPKPWGKQIAKAGVEIVQEEKRLRPFRKKAPQTYITKLARATTQR